MFRPVGPEPAKPREDVEGWCEVEADSAVARNDGKYSEQYGTYKITETFLAPTTTRQQTKQRPPGRHLRTTVRECLRRVRIARLAGLC